MTHALPRRAWLEGAAATLGLAALPSFAACTHREALAPPELPLGSPDVPFASRTAPPPTLEPLRWPATRTVVLSTGLEVVLVQHAYAALLVRAGGGRDARRPSTDRLLANRVGAVMRAAPQIDELGLTFEVPLRLGADALLRWSRLFLPISGAEERQALARDAVQWSREQPQVRVGGITPSQELVRMLYAAENARSLEVRMERYVATSLPEARAHLDALFAPEHGRLILAAPDPDSLLALLEADATTEASRSRPPHPAVGPPPYGEPLHRCRAYAAANDTGYVGLLDRGPAPFARDFAPFAALVRAGLGLYGSTPLRVLRDERAVAYGGEAIVHARPGHSVVSLVLSVDASAAIDALRVVLDELVRLRDAAQLDPAELARALTRERVEERRRLSTASQLVHALEIARSEGQTEAAYVARDALLAELAHQLTLRPDATLAAFAAVANRWLRPYHAPVFVVASESALTQHGLAGAEADFAPSS